MGAGTAGVGSPGARREPDVRLLRRWGPGAVVPVALGALLAAAAGAAAQTAALAGPGGPVPGLSVPYGVPGSPEGSGPPSPRFADDMPVPPQLHVALILKVLEYDRKLVERTGSEIRVGLVYRPDDPVSVAAKDRVAEVFAALAGITVRNVPIRFQEVPFTTASGLEGLARSGATNVFYVTPGHAGSLAGLLAVSEALGILTTTGVPDYVDQGVAVGIGIRADKPQVLINLPASRSAGSEFDVSLLRIARVIR